MMISLSRQPLNRVFAVLALLATCLVLTACAATNPLAVAETPAQKAYALERAYGIVLENAVDVAEDSATPATLRSSIQQVERRTTPVVDGLSNAFAEYEVIAAQVSAGDTSEERLLTAAANLEDWLTRAERALVDLSAALER